MIEESPGAEASTHAGPVEIPVGSHIQIMGGPYSGNFGVIVDYTRLSAKAVVAVGTELIVVDSEILRLA